MIIECENKLYPQKLKSIKNPPKQIYVIGDEKNLNEIGIAVIGSRSYSQYGEEMCKKFTKELVKYNINIISGLAKGIDSIAHETCIKNGGKTIAVLPCGINNVYPKENIKLAEEIISTGGTIITEYEPDEEPNSKKFLERNRIVSGLSIGTLVVEAGYRSGTSVTSRLTMEQGKPVFCIPSSLENRKGMMTNIIIQNGGNLVTCVEDILSKFENIKFNKKEEEKKIFDDVPEDLQEIYKIIKNKPLNINEIVRKTKLSISEVNSKLMLLEMEDKIVEISGQRFIRKGDL